MDSDPIEESPVRRPAQSQNGMSQQNTIATLPLDHGYVTQPTQPLQDYNQPEKLSQILVPGSSPPPTPQSRPLFRPAPPMPQPFMGMAPPGTAFRPPTLYNAPQASSQPQTQNQTQFSDFGDPEPAVSDSEDELESAVGNIPPSFRNGRTITQDQFRNMLTPSMYNPRQHNTLPQKRPADDSVSAYGNASRQKQPRIQSRPIPNPSRPGPSNPIRSLTKVEDIEDYDIKEKARRIHQVAPSASIANIVNALNLKRGNLDDAMDHVLQEMAQRRAAVDLTADDDAEGETDSDTVAMAKPTANRNAEAHKSGLAAYSRLQQNKFAPPSTPIASSPPRRPLGRLQRGVRPERSRSSSVQPAVEKVSHHSIVIDDDEDEDSDVQEEVIEVPSHLVDDKVFGFFKECSEKDLVSIIDCKPEDAEFFLSKRPFKSLEAARRVQRPAVPGKRKGGNQKALGDRLVDALFSVEESLQAVDRIVTKCKQFQRDVERELKTTLGVDVAATKAGDGLDIATFEELDASKADSGTGTPTPNTGMRIQQPANMSKARTLKDYQLVGLNWLVAMYSLRKRWARSNGCILADEMGLGKTYQVIAFISHMVLTGVKGRHLVVVPASTLENWLREFQQFSPDVHVEPYYGKASERDDQQEKINEAGDRIKVIVTTYSVAASDKDNAWLRKKNHFASCIFDEGHMLKNATGKRYRALHRLRADFRLFLTGTPLQNNLQELISVLGFIMPSLFEEAEDDMQLIFDCKAKTTDADHAALLASQRTNRAKEMLRPFILRRTKDQVLKDLPPKTNKIVYCKMTAHQRVLYDHFSKVHEQALADRKAGKSVDDGGGKFPHLQDRRAAAIHPLLRRCVYDNDDIRLIVPKLSTSGGRPWNKKSNQTIFEELTWASDWELSEHCRSLRLDKPSQFMDGEWMDSGKVEKLIELLAEHKAAGSRTLIFSQYAKVLDILGRVLETEDIAHMRLDGTTQTEHRLPLIDKFNEDKSIQAFMITTRSGGAGINLATADKVIIFDPSFNPQDDVQAANRAHRIGQTRPVEVITLITKGTIEEQIYKLGLSKLALDQRVAGGAEEDLEKGGEKAERDNMRKLEEMLLNGQITPPETDEDKELVGEGVALEDSRPAKYGKMVKDEEEETAETPRKATKLKIKVKERTSPAKKAPAKKAPAKKSPTKKKAKDPKKAFKEAMEMKGVEFAEDD